MGFLSGRATFERYWITHDPTPALGVDQAGVRLPLALPVGNGELSLLGAHLQLGVIGSPSHWIFILALDGGVTDGHHPRRLMFGTIHHEFNLVAHHASSEPVSMVLCRTA